MTDLAVRSLPYHPLADMAAALADGRVMMLLHSARGGRYTMLGLYPYRRLMQVGGDVIDESLTVDGRWTGRAVPGDALGVLGDWLAGYSSACPAPVVADPSTGLRLPMADGVMGFMSYDDGLRRDGIRSRHDGPAMPDAAWWWFDVILVEDHVAGTVTLIDRRHVPGAVDRVVELWDGMIDAEENTFVEQGVCRSHGTAVESADACATWTSDHNRDSYRSGIEALLGHMRDGDIYVTNYSLRLYVDSPVTPPVMFDRLRADNPAPFMAYVDAGDWQIISSSPERFLESRGRHVVTRPIKGTRPRGDTPDEDDRLRAELEHSFKDRSELLMITDLERNDLSRIAAPGTVVTTGFAELETYPHVFHLVSTVEADIAPDRSIVDVLDVMSPGGSITGAPKHSAMTLIDRYEHSSRGAYTGSLGYIDASGDCDLSILIRMAIHPGKASVGGAYSIGGGGGVTLDSDPDFEYDEAMQKTEALLSALGCDMRKGWHD
ncbi:anthranilate synthase component I family protein [Bifidobacterium callimiconis]|uniref:anthranilate synthase component I family protein n=1 Tax=Bifidobacterium callimiconis TaxID=2306973 RepID=UPI001BDDC8B9|nr:anthranilate synthase component I family protein [Bifidobacterium callimiconis]MBT1176288.1 anthranilate synthase component I family protein [Bifidobacterium callimiconis]